MPSMSNDTDRCIAALQAVELMRDSYGGGVEGCRKVQEILVALAMGDSNTGMHGGLRQNVADAISRAYLGSDLKEVQL